MSKFTVDSFIVELGFNENVIRGLQRVEKAALQSAQRIERNLNRAFKVDTKQLDSNLTSSLKSMEGKINKTFDRLEARAKNTKAFRFTSQVNDAINPPKQPRQPRISGNRAITAAYSANMTKLKGLNPIVEKYIKSQFYALSSKSKTLGNEAFNRELAKLNQSLRETLSKFNKTTSKNNHSENASNSLDVLATSAIKAGTAIYSFQTALEAYKKVMEVGLQRASAERSIDFVFDKDAVQVKEFTKSLAQTTGLDIAELQSQFAGFGASAKESMGIQGSEELFRNMIGYSRLMGRSEEEIKRALTALSQMAGKGQIMAEELKGQLAEAVPGMVQVFAKATGKTEQELFDAMKKGALKSADTLQKVTQELNKQITAKGGWKAISESTQAQLGNLKNSWNTTLDSIFRGSENGLQDFTRSLTTLLNSLGGSGKSLGESLGNLMTSMSHGVDSLTDISYKVRGFFDEVTLAYRGLTDEQKKVVDALGSGLINSLKVLAGVIAVNKVVGVTRSIYGLMTAITRLGQVADTTADNVNRNNGKPSRFNLGNMLLAVSAIYAGYERLASTPERMEAQAKLPELAKESGLKPVFTMDDVKGWFNSAAMNLANFQHPELITMRQDAALTNTDIQSLRDEISALSKRIQEPVKVSLGGEVAIKPDETSFMTFNSSLYDQYAEATLLSSSFPEDD
ncbi:membrane protein [Escherichia coli]|uniref:tape measure protein n=1 Tax=Escherichia coli TaxID=562 RepID=UPI0010CB73D2|nr:tape measure protein [Escherichia coli]GDM31075.1 membrane protein [Escherichia coli]